MNFIDWLLSMIFGKRNSDRALPNDVDGAKNELREGQRYKPHDEDVRFWEDDYCCSIFRPSQQAFIFVRTSLGTIDDVRFDKPTLDDAIREFEFYVEMMGYEPYYDGVESENIARGYISKTI